MFLFKWQVAACFLFFCARIDSNTEQNCGCCMYISSIDFKKSMEKLKCWTTKKVTTTRFVGFGFTVNFFFCMMIMHFSVIPSFVWNEHNKMLIYLCYFARQSEKTPHSKHVFISFHPPECWFSFQFFVSSFFWIF